MARPVLHTYGPANVDETLTLSLVNMVPGIRDNIFNQNPTLNYLYNKKGIKLRGGASISHGLVYATNGTAQSYSRYETLDVTPQDGLTRDQWEWAQYAVSMSIDGFTERVANQGDQALIDALDEKRMQAEESQSLLLEQHIFKGTPAANDLRSLPVIVLDSGTEGNIAGGANTWWQSTVTASGSYALRGRSDMTVLYNTLTNRNPAGLNGFIVSDQTSLEAYESSLVSQVRFQDTKMVDIGLQNLLFKKLPWFWSSQANSGVIYMLDDRALHFYVSSATDFVVTPFKQPDNQDARTAQILVACAFVTSRRRKLGKLTGVTA